MKNNRRHQIISLVINSVILITTITILIIALVSGDEASEDNVLASGGLSFFRFFTSDSNILLAIASGIMIYFNIQNLRQNRDEIPKWVSIFYLLSATSTTITFLTTVFFLGPLVLANGNNYFSLFANNLLFEHAITPILGIVVLIFFSGTNKLKIKDALFCIIPTFIYSIFYVSFVLSGAWPDFYGFTFGGKYWSIPFSILLFYAISFGIGVLLSFLRNKYID